MTLQDRGFVSTPEPTWRRLITLITGEEKTGKTYIACTAPQPVHFLSWDTGTAATVSKFQKAGHDIHRKHTSLPAFKKGASPADVMKLFRPLWDEFVEDWSAVISIGKGTVVVDTETVEYLLARYAFLGGITAATKGDTYKFGDIYAQLEHMIGEVYDQTQMSAIFLGKHRDLYVDDKNTGRRVRNGWKDLPYQVQTVAETIRQDKPGGGPPSWGLQVRDSRENPNMNGYTMWTVPWEEGPKDCTYDRLMDLTLGESP